MGSVISVYNQKGGTGKTTSVINLGAYFADKGCKVLIIDADPQANATEGLGVMNHAEDDCLTLLDVYNDIYISEAVRESQVSDNLHILPATGELSAVEISGQYGTELFLKNNLSYLETDYEYVLIDNPPSLGKLTIASLVASDYLVIPIQSEYYPLRGVDNLMSSYHKIKKNVNPKLDLLGVFITMYDSRTNLAKESARQVQDVFGDKMFPIKVRRNVDLAEAPALGQSIFTFSPDSNGAKDYAKLGDCILRRLADNKKSVDAEKNK